MNFKIPKVTFRTREGDEVETDGGCAIGGQWLNKTTDDYFKNKRVVLFSLPEHSHQHVLLNSYLGLKKNTIILKQWALMKYIVFQ